MLRAIFSPVFLLTLLLTGFTDQPAWAEPLSLEKILLNTLNYHPKTEALDAKLEQRLAKQQQAEGAFDWELEHNGQSRSSGYYDGSFAEQSISRQLPFANAKLGVGYRYSEGSLPVYEEAYQTLDGGEPNVKLKLSLLRNRAIDPKRQALQEATLGVELEQELRRLGLNNLLIQAANAYFDWYLNHRELQVAQELYQLAKTRHQGITQRVANGDLAKVVELEFQATLLSRQAKITELQQKQALAGLKLSLYQRSSLSEARDIPASTTPATLEPISSALDEALKGFEVNVKEHPSIKAIEFRKEQLETQRSLSQSHLLPELDLNVAVARDLGDGPDNLVGNESYVGLKLTAPIERRKAKGKLRAVEAEIKALAIEQRLTSEYLTNMLRQQQSQLHNQEQLLKLHSQQAELAQALAKVEVQRFKEGDSDLFLLNARETASAEAQLKVAQTYTNILRQKMMTLAQGGQLSGFVERLTLKPNFR